MRAIGVVSDTHAGSIYGLLPPGFVTSAGEEKQQTPWQKYLWECWDVVGQWFAENKVSGMVHNGDGSEGTQRSLSQQGTELSINLRKDQVEAAALCLQHIQGKVGKVPWYMVRGTPYHDEVAGQSFDDLAERIGAESYYGLGTGKRSREMLDLEVEGVIINFFHHISASAGLYRATAPDREALWSAVAGKEGRANRADCLVRSHVHYFIHLEHATKHIVITPCFQLQTSFMRRNSAYRMMPDIGAIIIWVDGEEKKRGRDPIRISKLLFPLPSIKPVKFPAT